MGVRRRLVKKRELPNRNFTQSVHNWYRVARVDVTQEMEKWAGWAILASGVHSAHFFVSCAKWLHPPQPAGSHSVYYTNFKIIFK